MDGLSEGTQRSVIARGMAARARDHGYAQGIQGFERGHDGQRGGDNRIQANNIVHADYARNFVAEARQLHDQAHPK